MNKVDLVQEVANQTGITKKTSREAVDAMIAAMTDSLGFPSLLYEISNLRGKKLRDV